MSKTARLPDPKFWSGRRVLVTGHTGFKGTWVATWLGELGAVVSGFALPPESAPSLYEMTSLSDRIDSRLGDLRDEAAVRMTVADTSPEIVLHMAAQPIVRRSIADPVETIATNVLGTAHLLNALRDREGLLAVLVVTSDKVYVNNDSGDAFTESDPLGGKDPYSASKAGAELVTRSFAQTYFEARGVPVATARGGNVVGGGDYAADRIIPDIIRAVARDETIVLRMPEATRPWQHVLDCIAGYLLHIEDLAQNPKTPRALNFGPQPGRDVTVAALTEAMLAALGRTITWRHEPIENAKEMTMLAVDSSAARRALAWRDLVAGDAVVDWTATWYKRVAAGETALDVTRQQIAAYTALGSLSS